MTPLWLIALLLTTPQWAHMHIAGSLEKSVASALPQHGCAVAAEVARLLRWRGDVNRRVHRGDTLALLYDVPPALAKQEPILMALRYTGLQVRLRAYRFADAAHVPRYFDAQGALIEPVLRSSPVANYVQITEVMQHGRGRRRHAGIDLKAPMGTPVVTPFAGQVRRINWSRRINGTCVEVAYRAGGVARFLHLACLAPGLVPGKALAAGAPLGWVGSTGRSSAAHLHYEVLIGGAPKEPLDVHGRGTMQLHDQALSAFTVVRDSYDRALQGPHPTAAHLRPRHNL